MKVINLLFIVSLGLLISCNKDSDEDEPICDLTNCVEGVCVNNSCDCTIGYEGSNCDTLQSNKFLGAWNLNFVCSMALEEDDIGTAVLPITQDANDITMVFFTLHGEELTAKVDGNNFEIIEKSVDLGGGASIEINGNGNLESETLTLTTFQSFANVVLTTCVLEGMK